MLKRLHIRLNEQGLIDLETWMIDFHCRSRNPSLIKRRKKGGAEEPQDHALGRSRGGLLTKIHMLCDANCVPLHFLLSLSIAASRVDVRCDLRYESSSTILLSLSTNERLKTLEQYEPPPA